MQASKSKLQELQTIISKMSLEACCVAVIPEFGVKWREVSQAVRNARLPMLPSSVARVLCRHAAKSLPQDVLEDILGRLRLKLVATQSRTWHVFRLLEPIRDESVMETIRALPHRVLATLRNGRNRNMRPEVQSVTLGDLIYLSVQMVSESRESSVLYMCSPPSLPVVLLTSAAASPVLKACVDGLGYKRFENASLHGKDIPSLLRLADPSSTQADHLVNIPEYRPTPTALPNGIDYTNTTYDANYIDSILGPNPPLLTDLQIKSRKMFFDSTRLDKNISLTFSLKSEDVARTLKAWVRAGAIAPTADCFQVFQQVKANSIQYTREDSD